LFFVIEIPYALTLIW